MFGSVLSVFLVFFPFLFSPCTACSIWGSSLGCPRGQALVLFSLALSPHPLLTAPGLGAGRSQTLEAEGARLWQRSLPGRSSLDLIGAPCLSAELRFIMKQNQAHVLMSTSLGS